MFAEIDGFVKWIRRRNPEASTWRDDGYDRKPFTAALGDRLPGLVTFHEVDCHGGGEARLSPPPSIAASPSSQ
jgi:hypothetical protein